MSVMRLSDKETFSSLKARDSQAYHILYKFYFPSVQNFIVKNSGTTDDAKDIFQETIIVLLEKVSHESFNLTSSLKTYIFAISSNLWLKYLREVKRASITNLDIYEQFLIDYDEVENEVQKENHRKATNIFTRLTYKCKLLLHAIFYDDKSITQVTEEFGYTTKHNAQNQKYKCLEQARKGMENLN